MAMYTPNQIEYALRIVADEFPAAGIQAFLIGGLAVNQYGYARSTLDVDFMVNEADQSAIHQVMERNGYVNRTELDNVVFYKQESGGFRVDFLSIDEMTHNKMGARAKQVQTYGFQLWVPHLEDLLATKIFALSSGKSNRFAKDLPDIVYLCLVNDVDVESIVKPLCAKYDARHVYEKIVELFEGIANDS